MSGLEVGSVWARVGARFDDDGFDKFDRRLDKTRRDARNDVDAKLKGDYDRRGFDNYGRGLDDAGKRSGRFSKIASGGFVAVKGAALGIVGAVGGAAAAIYLFSKASANAEASDARMKAQLKASGVSWQEHRKQIDESIQSLSKLAALDDEDLQDSFTNIFRVTGDVTKSLKLNALAADIARAKHIEVAKAGELVGKVAGGNTGILARYGIVIKKGATSTEALGELQKKFAGQAEAYGKTQGGAIDRVKVSLENVAEAAGRIFAPAITWAANKLSDFLDMFGQDKALGGGLKDGLKDVGGVLGWIVDKGKAVIGFFGDLAGSGDKSSGKLGDAFKAAKDYATELWSTVKQVARGIGDAFEGAGPSIRIIAHFLRDVLGVALTAVYRVAKRALPGISAILTGVAQTIRGVVDVIAGILTLDFGRAFSGAKRIVSGAVRVIGGVIRTITAPFREAFSAVVRTVGNGIGNVATWFRRLPGRIAGGLSSALSKVTGWAGDVASAGAKAGADLVSRAADAAKRLPGAIWNAIKGAAGQVAKLGGELASKGAQMGAGVVRAIVNAISSAPGAIIGALKSLIPGAIRKLASKVPGLGFLKARGGKAGPGQGGPEVVYGEGNKDEWWISQEGDRHQNIRWGVEALKALTGKNVRFFKGGGSIEKQAKAAAKKVNTGEAGLTQAENKIEGLNREYDQMDRRFSLTDEEFIVDAPDGTSVIDKNAINQRAAELDALAAKRADILRWLGILKQRADALLAALAIAIKRLRKAAKVGKKSHREKYAQQADEMSGRASELGDQRRGMDYDIGDAQIDLDELLAEKASVLGTTAPSSTGGGLGGTGSTANPADVAAAAAADFAAFQSAREDLFSTYGSNVVNAGQNPYAGATGAAAGAQYFGATGGRELKAFAAAGGRLTYVENAEFNTDFGNTPPSGDTFIHQQARELEVAFS